MTFFLANATALALADKFDDQVNAGAPPGLLKIYGGSVPADADASLGAATLLATLTFSNPAFGNAADANPGGRITASAITSDSSADATATATFFRITNAAGTAVAQGAVGTSGAELNFNTTAFVTGAQIDVTSMTVTVPES